MFLVQNGDVAPESFGERQRVRVNVLDHALVVILHLENISLFVACVVLVVTAHDHDFIVGDLDGGRGRQRE